MISHPFMSPAQPGDPPRHPPVLHDDIFIEPDILQHLVATTIMEEAPTDALIHAEQP